MMDGLPTGWARDVWEAAKIAGPFGTMLTLCLLVWVSRLYRQERQLNESYARSMFTLIESTKNALSKLTERLDGARGHRQKQRRG